MNTNAVFNVWICSGKTEMPDLWDTYSTYEAAAEAFRYLITHHPDDGVSLTIETTILHYPAII